MAEGSANADKPYNNADKLYNANGLKEGSPDEKIQTIRTNCRLNGRSGAAGR